MGNTSPWTIYGRSFLLVLSGYVLCLVSLRFKPEISPKNTSPSFPKKNHRTGKEDALTSSDGVLTNHSDWINVTEIAVKWNLTSSKAIQLLHQQAKTDIQYDPERDFIFFHHLLKSGGTSISALLQELLGEPYPGSKKSNWFDFQAAEDAVMDPNIGINNFKMGFAHLHAMRPTVGPDSTRIGKHLHSSLRKRLRLVTMLRDPLILRASNVAEWMCEHKNYLRPYHVQSGLSLDSCEANLTIMMDLKTKRLLQNICPKLQKQIYDQLPPAVVKNLPKYKRWCRDLSEGRDPFDMCRSIPALLESNDYSKFLHDKYRTIMGRYSSMEDDSGENLPVTAVEEYTLQDLGGLHPDVNSDEADFIWFGITERMHDSACLLFYTLRVKASEVPRHRISSCRPLEGWSHRDQEVVRARETNDYAVFRAANAILDVRVRRMRHEIQSLLEAGATLADLPHVGRGCFAVD